MFLSHPNQLKPCPSHLYRRFRISPSRESRRHRRGSPLPLPSSRRTRGWVREKLLCVLVNLFQFLALWIANTSTPASSILPRPWRRRDGALLRPAFIPSPPQNGSGPPVSNPTAVIGRYPFAALFHKEPLEDLLINPRSKGVFPVLRVLTFKTYFLSGCFQIRFPEITELPLIL